MTYLRGKKRGKENIWRRLLWGILILLLIFLFGNWVGGGLGVASTLARPFWFVGERLAVGAGGLWALWSDKEKLVVQNEALTNRLADLEARLARQNLLATENEKLRATIGLATPISRKIIAQVISGPDRGPLDTLLVDVGSEQHGLDTLTVGDLVGLEDGLALGRIIEVAAKTSKIKLFSAPGNELPAALGREASAPIQLVGRGLGNFTAAVPRGVEVLIGDEAIFNKGSKNWLVATVGSVDSGGGETMQKVFLRTPLNLNQLRYVEIYHY